jgi:hypothetical protein
VKPFRSPPGTGGPPLRQVICLWPLNHIERIQGIALNQFLEELAEGLPVAEAFLAGHLAVDRKKVTFPGFISKPKKFLPLQKICTVFGLAYFFTAIAYDSGREKRKLSGCFSGRINGN